MSIHSVALVTDYFCDNSDDIRGDRAAWREDEIHTATDRCHCSHSFGAGIDIVIHFRGVILRNSHLEVGLVDHRDGVFDGNGAVVKKEIDKIKTEMASTIYCSAMIYEMSDKDEEVSDFIRDCNMLSTALTKIYSMRFREDPVNEINKIDFDDDGVCRHGDLIAVADSLSSIAAKSDSQVISGIMSGCGLLTRSIANKIREVGKIDE